MTYLESIMWKNRSLLFVSFMFASSMSTATSVDTPSEQRAIEQPIATENQISIKTIKPYSATYSTVWKKGISLKVKGTQKYTKQDENTWLLSFNAKTFFASLKESSLFTMHKNHIQPLRYDYHTSAFGRKRDAVLTFDWDKKRVTNNVKNKPWKMAIEQGTLDKLSVQLQIRQDIRSKKNNLIYKVADGGHLKT